jgi:L-2,4-diaminobutyric acid acetyltransferase
MTFRPTGNDTTTPGTRLRHPAVADAPAMLQLVEDSGVLDPNSCYLYLLLCRDFSQTCLVAEDDQGLLGFVTAYQPPDRPQTLFVWQIAVAERARKQGLARRMLLELLAKPVGQHCEFLEATVAPSNTASRRLFESLARFLDVSCETLPGFAATDFGAATTHEAEPILRIGPFRKD